MKIQYTVTTTTTHCPYCRRVISKKTSGALTPLLSCLSFFLLPFLITHLIVRFLALKNPQIPKVGPRTKPCPHCQLPVNTGLPAVEDLKPRSLFIYRFRLWIYACYVLCGFMTFCFAYHILGSSPFASICDLLALLCLLGIVAICVVYRVKLAKYKEPTPERRVVQAQPTKSQPAMPNNWTCTCGRVNPPYCTSCVCGTNKNDVLLSKRQDQDTGKQPESPQ